MRYPPNFVGIAMGGAGTAVALNMADVALMADDLGVVALSGAVVLHEGSTILVVLNALRLLGYR